jgi:hypothetical protein
LFAQTCLQRAAGSSQTAALLAPHPTDILRPRLVFPYLLRHIFRSVPKLVFVIALIYILKLFSRNIIFMPRPGLQKLIGKQRPSLVDDFCSCISSGIAFFDVYPVQSKLLQNVQGLDDPK